MGHHTSDSYFFALFVLIVGMVAAKYKDKVSYTCLYQVTIFCIVTFLASTVFWWNGFKESENKQDWCTEIVQKTTMYNIPHNKEDLTCSATSSMLQWSHRWKTQG